MSSTSEPAKTYKKYVPRPEGLNLELHLAAVRTGLLHIQRCRACAEFRHPPRWYCPQCHSPDYDFVAVSGAGSLYSMAINHFTVDRAWIDEVPYVTAVVQLDEGPRIVGDLRGVSPAEVALGDAVQVQVEARGDEFAYLVVELVGGSAARSPEAAGSAGAAGA